MVLEILSRFRLNLKFKKSQFKKDPTYLLEESHHLTIRLKLPGVNLLGVYRGWVNLNEGHAFMTYGLSRTRCMNQNEIGTYLFLNAIQVSYYSMWFCLALSTC